MSSKACSKCNLNVTPKQNPGIVCVGDCKKPRHWKCTGLSVEEQKIIVDKKLSWSCDKCKRRSVYLVDSSSNSSLIQTSSRLSSTVSSTESVTELANKVSRLEALLQSAISRIDILESELRNKSAEIIKVASEVQRIEITSDTIEKHLIDENLEVQNLSETDLEDPANTAILIGEAIGCNILPSDLQCPPFVDRKRLRLTFKSKTTRRKFLLAGKNFNRANNRYNSRKIHINEELTLTQRRLFEATKTFKNSNNFKFCWFGASGQLLLKKNEQSQLHIIHSLDSLQNEALLSECERTENEITGSSSVNSTQ